MAYYGLKKPYFAPFNEDGTTYDSTKLQTVARAIAFSVTPNFAEGSLAADDDPQSEYDREFTDADVTLGTDTLPIAVHKILFGATSTDEDKTVVDKVSDNAAYVGVAVIAPQKVRGKKTWACIFMPKVKFAVPGDDFETKGNSISYKTPSITGKASQNAAGEWRRKHEAASEEDAIAWINQQFGAAASSGTGTTGAQG